MAPRVRKSRLAEPVVEIGGTDPMSELALRNGVPLCRKLLCTRAAGHDEDTGTKHVSASSGVAQLIWED